LVSKGYDKRVIPYIKAGIRSDKLIEVLIKNEIAPDRVGKVLEITDNPYEVELFFLLIAPL